MNLLCQQQRLYELHLHQRKESPRYSVLGSVRAFKAAVANAVDSLASE